MHAAGSLAVPLNLDRNETADHTPVVPMPDTAAHRGSGRL
jgi:hypothetical protein